MRAHESTTTQVQVGDLQVTTVSDGTFSARPAYFGPDIPARAHPELFSHGGVARLPIGCFLITGSPGRTVLVDAGLGPHSRDLPAGMRLAGGRLLEELGRIGVTAADVTDVVCTHLHSDHVGWLFDRHARPLFPQASITCGVADLDHFVAGPGEMAEHVRSGFLAAGDLLRAVTGEQSLVPGIRLLPTPGHTPGHLCVVVESNGSTVWLLGDAITCPVQLAEPAWHSFGDVDPLLAAETRDMLWGELSAAATLGVGAHFPGLRFGRVRVRRRSAGRRDRAGGGRDQHRGDAWEEYGHQRAPDPTRCVPGSE